MIDMIVEEIILGPYIWNKHFNLLDKIIFFIGSVDFLDLWQWCEILSNNLSAAKVCLVRGDLFFFNRVF